jgi:hypothetical protein
MPSSSLQRRFHLVDQLTLSLALPLTVHVGTGLLDHCQPLHPQHIVLQQRLFGL